MDPIKVWAWKDAPQKFKELSQHGGDEDWVAIIPPGYANTYIPWLESGSFGVCEISEHQLLDGSIVKIGAHS